MSESNDSRINRRSFLKTGALSGMAIGAGGLVTTACETGAAVTNANNIALPGQARNVIFLVSDGMSHGTLAMADLMLERNYGRPSSWKRLYHAGYAQNGLMDMASNDSLVTDSAAAACSWGSGRRINNGAVNVSPEGEELTPVLPIFRDAGKATGLVTTARLTHATPAGFSANVEARGMEDEIAQQYSERGYDLLLGGGSRHFSPADRNDGRDLYASFEQDGYSIVRTRDELQNYDQSSPVLGTFWDSHLPYELDRLNITEQRRQVPSLAEMTETALQHLDQNRNGFILQIEGGRIDHAAHSNDTAGLVFDQIAFDDAIGSVMEFANGRDDTLVIITTDHGNANPGVNGIGSGYRDSNHMFDSIDEMQRTNNWILSGLNSNSSIREITDRIEYAWPYEIEQRDAEILQQSLRNDYQAAYRARSSPSAVISAIQANYSAVNWIGSMHTSDYVELAAFGPGSEAVTQFTRNTELFDVMLQSAGIQAQAA